MIPPASPKVWLLPFAPSLDRVPTLLPWLSPNEKIRADAFATETLRAHWILARAGLRLLLGRALEQPPAEVEITTTRSGKPVLAGDPNALHFNLSHCDTHAAYVLSPDVPVGIDLESRSRGTELPTCRETFCHPEEATAFATNPPTDDALLRLWCAKEAALKAAGTGFQVEPSQVLVTGWETGKVTATWPGSNRKIWHIAFPEIPPSLCLAVAMPCHFPTPTIRPWEEDIPGSARGSRAWSGGSPDQFPRRAAEEPHASRVCSPSNHGIM